MRHQAFRIGASPYAFQCHFESTPAIVDIWNRRELISNPARDQDDVLRRIQQAQADFSTYLPAQSHFAETVMQRWLNLISGGLVTQ